MTSRPTILLVAHTFAPFDKGGVTSYLQSLAPALVEWRPVIFHPFHDLDRPNYLVERDVVNGIEVVRVNRHQLLGYQEYGDEQMERIFAETIRSESAVVAHFHHLADALSPSLIDVADNAGLPTILTLHDAWTTCIKGHAVDSAGLPCSGAESVAKCSSCVGGTNPAIRDAITTSLPLRNRRMADSFSRLNLVTSPSKYLAALTRRAPWAANVPVEVRSSGLDDMPAITVARQSNRSEVRFGVMANISRNPAGIDTKGGMLLVAAAKALPSATFALYGALDDEFRDAFSPLPNVQINGAYDYNERTNILASFDALLITSPVENFSTVAREAQAAGVPVISSNGGGLGELVRDGVDGLLFPAGDVAAFISQLSNFLQDSELRTRLAAGSPTPLTMTSDAGRWSDTYSSLVPSQTAPSGDRISVVVTTYNRHDYLKACLESLCHQSLPRDQYEVIVVDDSSPEDPKEIVSAFKERLNVRYTRHENNLGLGEARNTGVALATAPVVLLFDDDDTAGYRLVEEHLLSHLKHAGNADAVLGFTGLDVNVLDSNLTFAVTQTLQTYLSYRSLRDGQELPWHCAWGGRSSFKTQLLIENPYAVRWMEDMELAWRLRDLGLRVFYNRSAVQYITAPQDVEGFARRSAKHGDAALRLSDMHTAAELTQHLNVDRLDQRLKELDLQVAEAKEIITQLDQTPRAILDASPVQQGDGTVVPASALLDSAYKVYFEHARIEGAIAARDSSVERPASSGKSVLFIDAVLPWYDRAAGAQRCFEMVKLMVAEGHDVTFLARYGKNQERYANELRRMGVTVHLSDPERLARDGIVVDAPPLNIAGILRDGQFDLAIIEFFYIAEQYLPLIRRYSPNTKIAVDTVDIHYVRERRQAAISGDTAMAATSEITKSREAATYGQADFVIAVTEVDRSIVKSLSPHVECVVVSMINQAVSVPAHRGGRKGLVFVGNFGHAPNADGAIWFAKEVLPLLNAKKPGLALTVIGNNPPAELQNVKNVVCTGWVESFQPYLDASLVSVAPLRYGSGVKGKIVDAMSVGLPVVTTPVGAEGMNLANNTAAVADDAQGFADAVNELLEDHLVWQTFSDNGRKHVDEHFGLNRARTVLSSLLPSTDQYFATVDRNSIDAVASAVVDYVSHHQAGDGAVFTASITDQSLSEDAVFNALASALVTAGFDLDHIPDVSVTRA